MGKEERIRGISNAFEPMKRREGSAKDELLLSRRSKEEGGTHRSRRLRSPEEREEYQEGVEGQPREGPF